MSQELTFAQGDVSVQADFAAPAFDFLSAAPDLYGQLWTRLSPHGLRPADMRFEAGGGNLGELQVRCFLLGFGVTASISVERADVRADLARVSVEQAADIVVGTLETVRPRVKTGFAAYTVSVAVHGLLKGATPETFIGQFTRRVPDGLGPLVGSAVIFYFGAEAERITSFVTLDLSASVQGGVFVRTQAVWDASKVEPQGLPDLARAHTIGTLGALGLTLVR